MSNTDPLSTTGQNRLSGTQEDIGLLLYTSVASGRLGAVQHLLTTGSGLEPRHINSIYHDYRRETPLHAACETGSLRMVEILLEAGAVIESDTYKRTPLHIAATQVDSGITKALLDNFPNHEEYLRQTDSGRETALTNAIAYGRLENVKLLLKAESELGTDTQWDQLFSNHTAWLPPAHGACFSGQPEILRYFIEELNIGINSRTPVNKWIYWPSASSTHPNLEVTLLQCALGNSTYSRALECMAYLIRRGADIFHRSNNNVLNAVDLAWRTEDFMSLALMARKPGVVVEQADLHRPEFRHQYGLDHNMFEIVDLMLSLIVRIKDETHFDSLENGTFDTVDEFVEYENFISYMRRQFYEIMQASRRRDKWYREPGYMLESLRVPIADGFEPVSVVSLAMPFFAFRGRKDSTTKLDTTMESEWQVLPVTQTCHTLDEYCNPGLDPEDLTKRNMDQVLVRYVMDLKGIVNNDDYSGPLLVVPQAWIWSFHDCLVTSGALRNSTEREKVFNLEGAGEDEEVGIILSFRINALAEHIPELGLTLLNAFARSIASISEEVNEYLNNDEINNINIDKEKLFFHKIEDIREELAMIQMVLLEQEDVWREYASSTWPKCWLNGPEGTFQPPVGAFEEGSLRLPWKFIVRPQQQFPKFKRRLKILDDDAARVQRSIELKLDLKQKHASLHVARTGSVMSASVFGFTIITVIFTPLSFMVGLFALPIDRLQQNQVQVQGGDSAVYSTRYIGKWIATAELASLLVTGLAAWAALEFFMKVEVTRHTRNWLADRLNHLSERVRVKTTENVQDSSAC